MLQKSGSKIGRKKVGINFNRSNGISESYVGRFDKENPEDMAELEIVKQMIRWINKDVQEVLNYGTNRNFKKWRLEYKGREPYKKMKTETSKGPVKYKPNGYGALVGGMKNARVIDAYIYRRYSYYD